MSVVAVGYGRTVARRAIATTGRLFGAPPVSPLASTHLALAVGDAFITVSLAGSLFFSVSIDAARPRILGYLILTLAPFAIVAPVIGPLIDRVRGGYRMVVVASALARVVLSALLVVHLQTVWFYPLALAVLVAAKTYGVARAALVPRLTSDPAALVAVNARISRLGLLGNLVGGALAAALLAIAGASAVVGLAGVAFAVGAGLGLRIPRTPPAETDSIEELAELRVPQVQVPATSWSIMRAAAGFLSFLVAFELKRQGAPIVVYGAVAVVSMGGAFGGTLVGPQLRRHLHEPQLMAAALALPAVVALAGSAGVGLVTFVAVSLAMGVAGNVGKQAFDALVQRWSPASRSGRAFAGLEARFQLAWVFGAVIAVLLRPVPWIAFALLGLLLGLGALLAPRGTRLAQLADTAEPGSGRPTLPLAVLGEARRLHARGEHAHAVLEAALAVEAAGGATADGAEHLRRLRTLALQGQAGPSQATEAIDLASHLVEHHHG